jgi:hypothetical protein
MNAASSIASHWRMVGARRIRSRRRMEGLQCNPDQSTAMHTARQPGIQYALLEEKKMREKM